MADLRKTEAGLDGGSGGSAVPISFTADPKFIHLRVHSSYSVAESVLTIAQLADLAKKDRPAGARADRYRQHVRRAGVFRQRWPGAGIQPIIGCSLAIDFGDQDQGCALSAVRRANTPARTSAAMNEEGYLNLMRLSSRGFLDPPANERAHLKLPCSKRIARGLIALYRWTIRSARSGNHPASATSRDVTRRGAGAAVRSPALCGIAAPRPADRA